MTVACLQQLWSNTGAKQKAILISKHLLFEFDNIISGANWAYLA